MIRWIERAVGRKPLPTVRKRSRLAVQSLEDRTTPTLTLPAPTFTSPATAVRADQDVFTITGSLGQPAGSNATLRIYQDTNHNGQYDPAADALVSSTSVAQGTTAFSTSVTLQPNRANQFFALDVDATGRSPITRVPLIVEDSMPPTVTRISLRGPAKTTGDSAQFWVRFSEKVTGVDAADFQAVTTGTVATGPVTVTGSGALYTVTVGGLTGTGTVGLAVVDDDSIHDLMTDPAQDHPLGGTGTGNGNFTGTAFHSLDHTAPTVLSIDRTSSVIASPGTVSYKVTFSEYVKGVNASDFGLSGSLAGAKITGVSGSGSTYTVTVNTGTGAGSVRLDLLDNNSIVDLSGNPLGGAIAGDGSFTSGSTYEVLASDVNSVATIVLPAIHLNLLGLHVDTSEVIVSLSADAANGKLLGNLLTTATHLIDLQQAADALNQVLSTTVGLLNSSNLGITLGSGSFDSRPQATTELVTLHVAPVDLDLLGAVANTNPIDVRVSAESGTGLVLGNIVSDLANLFNDLPGTTLNIDTLNQKLSDLLGLVNNAVGSIPPADTPTVQPSPGQVLSLTVPALNLNLLGLNLQTTPITVNANAITGNGNLLGNVLTSLLNTLDATPDKVAQLNNTLNSILGRVVGVLNAASLTVSPALVSSLPTALQTLLNPVLVAPAGSSVPVLDLVIASQDGTTPPVDVNLLGLDVTTSNIDAKLTATTGDGQILGNLLYNLANLANPSGSSGLLALLNALGSGNLGSTAGQSGGSLSGTTSAPQQLLSIQLKPIDLNLLGLEVKTDPVVVTLSTQGGDGKLLGNLLGALSTIVNFQGVGTALNNALGSVVDLVNSTSLTLPSGAVGSGSFDSRAAADTSILSLYIAPVHLDLLGLVVTTEPIHATITAHSGDGLVLGNVVGDLAHLFDNPPSTLTVDDVNARLATLLDELNQQIPNIPAAATPPVNLGPNQFLQLTVPAINLNLLGLAVQTTPITVNAFDQTGNGNLLGNVLTSLLNTIDATPGNLTVLSQNLNGLLAKVVGVLNAAGLTISQSTVSALPQVLQTLLDPLLVTPTPGASVPILNLVIASPDGSTPPVDANLLGLEITTSDINAQISATTGDGQILGNLLYNVAHLLDSGNTTSLLLLLTELAGL